MSEITTAGNAAPTSSASNAAPAQGGNASPQAMPVIGSPVSADAASTTSSAATQINAYEERYGQIGDAEGNFNDGTRAYLASLGMDQGRVDQLMRQGSFDNAFKALDHAQALIEKRDGNRDYIPDPSDEVKFNQWRDEKGIPIDPVDPSNGYNFKSGLPDGVEPIIGSDVLTDIGSMLHGSNMPREQANALIAKVNASLMEKSESQKASFEQEQTDRIKSSHEWFDKQHGYQSEAKGELVGHINKTYGLDASDPHDQIMMTNPKYLAMAVDLASFRPLTANTPESGGGQNATSGNPDIQIQQIMKNHPRGAWKRDPVLSGKMQALAKQSAAMRSK